MGEGFGGYLATMKLTMKLSTYTVCLIQMGTYL